MNEIKNPMEKQEHYKMSSNSDPLDARMYTMTSYTIPTYEGLQYENEMLKKKLNYLKEIFNSNDMSGIDTETRLRIYDLLYK